MLRSEFLTNFNQKIRNANNIDIDSKLGTYLQVNPNLESPTYRNHVFEIEKIHITRFRTGSNNLLVETGRYATPKIPRENRLCTCGESVQTLRHVLISCPLIIRPAATSSFTTISEYFQWEHLHEYLIKISRTLKIEL